MSKYFLLIFIIYISFNKKLTFLSINCNLYKYNFKGMQKKYTLSRKIVLWLKMLFLWFLSYFIKKDKNLYLFVPNLWKGFNWNTKALFLYYKKRNPDKKIYYFSEWNLYDKNMDIFRINLYKIFLKSSKIFIDGTLWDVLPGTIIFGKFNIIHTWHWEPIKKLWFSIKYSKFSYLDTFFLKRFYLNKLKIWFVWNKNSQKNMSEAFPWLDFKITWLARNDIFFHDYFEYSNIKSDFWNFDKVILYAPTWRDTKDKISPFSYNFLLKLNNYLIKNNYILLVKWHLNTHSLDVNNFSNIQKVNNKNYDIQDILKYSDILITDYSSIYIDYLLTNNPIIFYSYDLDSYLTNDREMYYTYDDVIIPSTKANNENDLLEILKNLDNIKKTDYYQKQYHRILNFFHKYKDWKNCYRIVKELEKI